MTLVDELKKKTNAAVDLLLCRSCTVEDKKTDKTAPGTQVEKSTLPPIDDVRTRNKPRCRESGNNKTDKNDERIRSLDLKTKAAKGQYCGSKTRRVSNPKQVRNGDHTFHRVRQLRELSVVKEDTSIIGQGKCKTENKGSNPSTDQIVKLPDLPKASRKPRPPKTPPGPEQPTAPAGFGPVFIDHRRVVPREEVDRFFDLDDLPCGMSARPGTRAGRCETPAKSARKDPVPDSRHRRRVQAEASPRDDSRTRDRLDARRAFVIETSPRVEARRRQRLDACKSFQAESVAFPGIDLKRTMLEDHRIFAGSPAVGAKPRKLREDHRVINVDASATPSSQNRDRIDARKTFEVEEVLSPRDSKRRDRIDAKRALQAEINSQETCSRPSSFGTPRDLDNLISAAPITSLKRTTVVAPGDDPLSGLDSLLKEAEKYEENRKRLFAEAAARRPPTASSKKCRTPEALFSFPSTRESCTTAVSAAKSTISSLETKPKTLTLMNAGSLPLPKPLPVPNERMRRDREIRKQEMKMIDDLLADLDL